MTGKYGWCLTGQCVDRPSEVRCPGVARESWQAQAPCSCSCHSRTYTLEELL